MSSGHVADIVDEPQMTQCMVRPRVARGFVDLSILHQCIRPHIAAVVLRAIMNISARAGGARQRNPPSRSGTTACWQAEEERLEYVVVPAGLRKQERAQHEPGGEQHEHRRF